jgi:uncharacterized protein (TIGR00297 family)
VTSTLRRAAAFAAVSTLSLAAPVLGRAAAAPFAAVAVAAAFLVTDGPMFELFARPGDHRDGRLNGLAGFALAATALAVLTAVPPPSLPVAAFVGAVVVLAWGNVGARVVESARPGDEFATAAGFAVVGFAAGVAGMSVAVAATGGVPPVPQFAVLSASGAIAAALLRSVLFERDDPVAMLSVGLLLWLLSALVGPVGPVTVAVALGVTLALGYVSYALGTASVTGMLTGVLLGLLVIILGGAGWFAVLISFFAVGSLSTKFRYGRKLDRGVAQENEGARGTSNVLGNAAVALASVIGFAASGWFPGPTALVFQYAFAGSIAAAMSDTLSSEVGGLFDRPRLITTLERVPPGTDGGVTWQGELAGIAGAGVVAAIAVALLPFEPPGLAAAVIVGGGLVGMTVDSVLGATVEGDRVGNETVNLVATLAGAAVTAGLALAILG